MPKERIKLSYEAQEHQLWEASQNYMKGKIGKQDLERIEKPHRQDLRQALISLPKRRIRVKSFAKPTTRDDRERQLWMASRLYMNGEIDVDQLEYIEISHTKQFRFALLSLARRRILWHLIDLLPLRYKRQARQG